MATLLRRVESLAPPVAVAVYQRRQYDTRYLARPRAESLAMAGDIGREPGHDACHSRPPAPVAAFTLGTSGTALTLKLTITASGLSGTITGVSVQLVEITTEFIDDLDLLLIHPNGSNNLVFMSDSTNSSADNLTGSLTISDSGATCLPRSTLVTAGSTTSPRIMDRPKPCRTGQNLNGASGTDDQTLAGSGCSGARARARSPPPLGD